MSTKLSVSLTHVEYDQGDKVGYVLAYCSLFPIFLLISFITLIVIRRGLVTVFFFLGLLLNESLNISLKHIIKEPRPVSGISDSVLRVEYGMPSSHAQFMAFFATFISLILFIRTRLSEGMKDILFKGVVSLGAVTGAILCSISRVYLGYHSTTQVIYGVLTGIITASIWFSIVHFLIAPYFHWVYSWKINDYLLLKDFSLIPNCLWYEYTAVRHETKKDFLSDQSDTSAIKCHNDVEVSDWSGRKSYLTKIISSVAREFRESGWRLKTKQE